MPIFVEPVILCGGSGSRLWPLSREGYPKQFLRFQGEETLLQNTATRIEKLQLGNEFRLLPPLVVCNETHRFLAAEQLRLLDLKNAGILLEPEARNTAPALTAAAAQSLHDDEDPVLVVMPADHHIRDEDSFRLALVEAIELAAQGDVVTLGVQPTHGETGFGYIRKGAKLPGNAFELAEFVEKPDLDTAVSYVQSGQYLWNSGWFILRASVWLEAIRRLHPQLAAASEASAAAASRDGDFIRLKREEFAACPSISIDYAVMEPLSQQAGGRKLLVLPVDVGWSDLGSWSAVAEVLPMDEQGNASHGDVFHHDTRNTLLFAEKRLVAAIGVEDLVVVETADAVLVAHKDQAQEVRKVTDFLRKSKRQEHLFHARVPRPWGDYEGIDRGARYQVKHITVKPGASLSLQLHHHRAEHWIVVSGTAMVTRGEETFLLSENESTYIPLGVRHRLKNPGVIPLEIIEVQSGSYLGEDDIQRFEDQYNR